MSLILVFLVLIFLHTLISGKLKRIIITTPIAFTAAGMLVALAIPEWDRPEGGQELFLTMAEIGLVLLLFTDASRTGLRELIRVGSLPVRLLSVGMLLTILLGALVAKLIFPALTIWEAGILAAILAPTDAGLGQLIVTSPRVPMKIREALNVEAGFNDGLSVPFLLFFIALAVPSVGGEPASFMNFVVEQLGYGFLVGAALAWWVAFCWVRPIATDGSPGAGCNSG